MRLYKFGWKVFVDAYKYSIFITIFHILITHTYTKLHSSPPEISYNKTSSTTMELHISLSSSCKTICKGTLLVCFSFLLCCVEVQSVLDIPESQRFPALLVFGDSIVDPGNNNGMATPSRADYPPYGQDFPGGKVTGRFSNGKLATDFMGT